MGPRMNALVAHTDSEGDGACVCFADLSTQPVSVTTQAYDAD
jgi:hypothetical protein